MVASAFTAPHAAHSVTTAAEQHQEPALDSVYSACIIFVSDWLQEECVKFPVSQFLASVGRTASASQSAALYSAKLATVESRDQMAQCNILAAAGLELNHCNKHVNAKERLAVIASPALAWHSSIAPNATEHESEQLLDKLLATLKTTPVISAMLDDDSMVSAQAATFMDSLQQGVCSDDAIPAVCWRLVAISLQREIFVLDSQYWNLSYYSCAAGPISVHASTDATKPVKPLLKQAWTQPGFHYGIGCLPLPDCLKSRDTKIFLLTGAGKLISTTCTLNARSAKMETAAAKLDGLQFGTVTLAGDTYSTDDASA